MLSVVKPSARTNHVHYAPCEDDPGDDDPPPPPPGNGGGGGGGAPPPPEDDPVDDDAPDGDEDADEVLGSEATRLAGGTRIDTAIEASTSRFAETRVQPMTTAPTPERWC